MYEYIAELLLDAAKIIICVSLYVSIVVFAINSLAKIFNPVGLLMKLASMIKKIIAKAKKQ